MQYGRIKIYSYAITLNVIFYTVFHAVLIARNHISHKHKYSDEETAIFAVYLRTQTHHRIRRRRCDVCQIYERDNSY